MSLIKLEDVLHRIYSEPNTSDKLYQDINSLPQYNPAIDFEEMILQLKRKNKKSSDYCDDKLAGPVREKLIEEFEELLKLPK